MKTIIVTDHVDVTYPNTGRYIILEMSCGKHSAIVSISQYEFRVIVHNSSHRAWKGIGKAFPSAAEARANYRTPEIRSMIEHARDVAARGA